KLLELLFFTCYTIPAKFGPPLGNAFALFIGAYRCRVFARKVWASFQNLLEFLFWRRRRSRGNMNASQPSNVSKGKQAQGFSLIELLVVVAIILIIAAIAIPNLIKAKISANEAAAVSSIHAVNTAEIAYQAANPSIGYSVLLSDLGPTTG